MVSRMTEFTLVARYTTDPPVLDGRAACPVWQQAVWSPRFVDMGTGGPALYETRAALGWSDTHLYVAYRAEDPCVEATLTTRDAPLFQESDLELLIDGGDAYYELEWNALGTIYEVLFVWKDAFTRGSRFDRPELDVHDPLTRIFAGDNDRTPATFWDGDHPRGARWAFRGWDLPGLQVMVHVDGRINDASHVDRGWSAEIAIPWAGLELLANGRALPPRRGDEWRMCLARFQRIMSGRVELQPHPAWVVTPHGVLDTHRPDRWTTVTFEDDR
jgi:hypothetical protein